MADPELVRVLDYILNRCDENSIEAIAAAIIRRRRELTLFGDSASLPDPGRLTKELSSQINIEGAIEGLQQNIRDYAVRVIRQEAPELTDKQVEKLTRAWIPEAALIKNKGRAGENKQSSRTKAKNTQGEKALPRNLLASMIDQFVSFSLGHMEKEEDRALRNEMGPWPDKYWKSFPQVIRLLITDYLKGEMEEADFNTRIGLALSMQ